MSNKKDFVEQLSEIRGKLKSSKQEEPAKEASPKKQIEASVKAEPSITKTSTTSTVKSEVHQKRAFSWASAAKVFLLLAASAGAGYAAASTGSSAGNGS
jgi:hypothetical protein